MGLQLAGSSFINPGTPLRAALTKHSVEQLLQQTNKSDNYRPISEVVTAQSMVNAIVALAATGGSTNLTLHLIAMAKAAGILINWEDMDAISRITPLLARVYPNGQADVNHFEQAGGLPFVMQQLRQAGLLNEDVVNVMGQGLDAYTCKPYLAEDGQLHWSDPIVENGDTEILSTVAAPFSPEGGLRLMQGNLGTGIVKISAVAEEHRFVEAPCKVFDTQASLKDAFDAGELECDFVAVVRFQGPAANGMPELHKLVPYLGIQQDKGFKVALVTDGRMSGASGKVLAAIHLGPEAKKGGLLAYLQDGDIIRVDANTGEVAALLDEKVLGDREPAPTPVDETTIGRGLFKSMRNIIGVSTDGASLFE